MSRATLQTEIEDVDHQPHRYGCTLHPAGEGFDLATELAQVVGGTLGRLFASVSGPGNQADPDADGDGGIGAALEHLPTAILDKGGHKLAKRILHYTGRESTPDANGRAKQERLRDQKVFDDVFAGNYNEMIDAVTWVLKVNYGPFFEGITDRLSGLLANASNSLPAPPLEEPIH